MTPVAIYDENKSFNNALTMFLESYSEKGNF